MEHANKETSKSPETRIVHFDEEFAPFYPAKKTEEMSAEDIKTYLESLSAGIPIELQIKSETKIPFFIRASPANSSKFWTITPFNPEVGYQIDIKDRTLEGRKRKLQDLMSLDKDDRVLVHLPKAPLWLSIDSDRNILKKTLCEKTDEKGMKGKIPPETLDLLKRIRVEASFPNGKIISEPSLFDLPWRDESGLDVILTYLSFYPENTGPLPTIGHLPTPEQHDGSHVADILCEKGIAVHLPNEPEKLGQIRMSFFLAEEREMQKAY